MLRHASHMMIADHDLKMGSPSQSKERAFKFTEKLFWVHLKLSNLFYPWLFTSPASVVKSIPKYIDDVRSRRYLNQIQTWNKSEV